MRAAVLFLLLAGLPAFSETGGGSIGGTICDMTGAAVPGAAVEIRNAQTKAVYSAISTSTGTYAIPQLPTGQYAITVQKQGMKPYAHSYLAVDKGVVREDVTLERDDNPAYVFPYNPPPSKPAVLPPARDFYAEDAEFVLSAPVLSLNGAGVELPKNSATVKGKIVWVYVPGHGRYLLSLASSEGFSLAGRVGGTSVEFRLENEDVQIDAADRILMGSATYNLYVLHQSDWLPPNEGDRAIALIGSTTGSTDRLR